MKKICLKCKNNLDISDFYKHKFGKNGYVACCKNCMNKARQQVNKDKQNGTYISKIRQPRLTEYDLQKRKEELKQYSIKYRKDNRILIAKKKKEYITNIKLEGIKHYGGKCSCCGETTIEFLTLEHKNGRNKTEKRYTGKKAWAKVKSEGYPDNYTVLCFNCNCAKGAYGICPHQKKNLK